MSEEKKQSKLVEEFKRLPAWLKFLVIAIVAALCSLGTASLSSCSLVRVASDGSVVETSVRQTGIGDSSEVVVKLGRN